MSARKKCAGPCGKTKAIDKSFYKYPNGRVMPKCRDCEAERKKQYRRSTSQAA